MAAPRSRLEKALPHSLKSRLGGDDGGSAFIEFGDEVMQVVLVRRHHITNRRRKRNQEKTTCLNQRSVVLLRSAPGFREILILINHSCREMNNSSLYGHARDHSSLFCINNSYRHTQPLKQFQLLVWRLELLSFVPQS